MNLTQFLFKENENFFSAQSPALLNINNHLKNLRREALRGTSSEPSVLILGESGSGKEGLARMIFQGSRRSNKPWITLNCALAGDQDLLEKEIFGEEKVAFNQKCVVQGIFDLAQEGTLFIEKIEHLSPPLQSKLLQVIQTRKYRRVSGAEDLNFDIRLIADATSNVSDSALIQALSTITLDIPPLRERVQDILPTATYFAQIHFKNEGKPFLGFTQETETALTSYSWPGNTEELIYLIKRAALLSRGNDRIDLGNLGFSTSPVTQDSKLPEQQTYTHLKKQWCDSFEKNYIASTLSRHKGNVSAAAREAKIDRSNFLRLMRRHGMKALNYRSSNDEIEELNSLKAA